MSETECWPWVITPRQERDKVWIYVSETDPNVGERWHPPGAPPLDQSPEAVAARAAERAAKREQFFQERGLVPQELLSQPPLPLSREERSVPLGWRIRARREGLGKTYQDMNWVLGPDHETWGYGDIWEEEFVTYHAELGKLRRVYAFLRFEPFELLDLKCAFHKGRLPYQEYYAAGRDEIVRRSLQESGLTVSEFAGRSGFYASSLERAQADSEELETWILDEIDVLAEVLRLPVQLLLRLRCPKCGR